MRRFLDDWGWPVVISAVMCFIGFMLALGAVSRANRPVGLQGCEFLGLMDTETRVYCGKACTRPLTVKMYRCGDRIKLEGER